jgi:hypothetical protein
LLASSPPPVRVMSASPLALTPVGYTYSREQLLASGRLRDGGVLDLSGASLSPGQLESIVQMVVDRLQSRVTPSRSFAQVTAQPAVPSRSAPVSTLDKPVHMSQPKVPNLETAAPAKVPSPPKVLQPPKAAPAPQVPGASAKAATKAKVSPPAPSVHNMSTRSASAAPKAAAGTTSAPVANPPPASPHTMAVQVHSTSLPLSQWRIAKRGMPLGKAVAYCHAKGVKVSMDLLTPEEITNA